MVPGLRLGGLVEGIVVVNHRVETLAGAAVLVDVLGEFGSGGGAGGVRVRGFGGPGHGALSLSAPGVFRYVPQAGFVGLDYLQYVLGDDAGVEQVSGWVEIRVWAVNGPPVTVGDLVLVEGDGPLTFDVLANDRDPGGDALRITGFTMPAKGQLVLDADQRFTYWPGPGFLLHDHSGGHDSFTYSIRDVRAAGDGQVGTAEAQVTLLAPAVAPPVNSSPLTVRDAVVTPRDTPVTIDVLANDTDADGDPLRVVGLTLPLHGHVALEADQTVTYTPAPDFVGIDDFTYIADDGRGGRSTGIVAVEVVP